MIYRILFIKTKKGNLKHQLLPQSTKKQAHRYDDDERKEEYPGLVHQVEGGSATSYAQVFSPNEEAEYIIKQIGQEGQGECTIVSVVASYCANKIRIKILERASGSLQINLLGTKEYPISEDDAKAVNNVRYRQGSEKRRDKGNLLLYDYHMAAAYCQQSIKVEGTHWSTSHSGKTKVYGQGAVTAASTLAGGPASAHQVKKGKPIPTGGAIRIAVKDNLKAIEFIKNYYSIIKGVTIRRKYKYTEVKEGKDKYEDKHGDHVMPVIFLNSKGDFIDPPYWIDQRENSFPDNKITLDNRKLNKIGDIVIQGSNGVVLWQPIDIIIIV